MHTLSMFDKEPGIELPSRIEHICRNVLDVVRPQLFFIRDHYFLESGKPWSEGAFPKFIRLPLVSGYILGVVGTHPQLQKKMPTEADILRCVIEVDNHFTINHLNVELSLNYVMQQSIFKFGLDIGTADASHNLTEQARMESSQYVLLASICMLLMKYADAKTLRLNLGIFCKLNRILPRNDEMLDEIIRHWDVHKQYDMN